MPRTTDDGEELGLQVLRLLQDIVVKGISYQR